MQQCQTCGGRYESTLPNGMDYYHVCPPLAVHELEAAIAAGTLTFDAATQARYDAAVKADALALAAPGSITQVQLLLGQLSVPRPNTRNENIAPAVDAGKDVTIVSPGLGALELPPALRPPVVVVPGV